jgi:signal transduction histidine kinase
VIGPAVAPWVIVITVLGGLLLYARMRWRAAVQAVTALEHSRAAAAASALHAGEAAARLREMLDAVPFPVWRRDPALADCNRAYAAILGIPREIVLAGGRALTPGGNRNGSAAAGQEAPGQARSEQAHVVIGGQRRLLELTEVPNAAGEAIGFAIDRTDAERAQSELRRHLDAHADVLESISAAVAIFGPDRKLIFSNSAFAALWRIEEAWLAAEPTLGEILERLRESRRIPEFADFRAFKRERCEMFTALIEPRHELMHLPDGRTLQLTVSPHPFGGLTFVYQDVSDHLALECSYNTLIQVQRATLDHLSEGIAVYGSDGRLKLHNPAFRAMWGLSEADVAGEPHVGEIVEKVRGFIDDGGDWPGVKERLVAKVTAQNLTSGPLYRRDGSMLQVASVPLPDGEVLLTYLDVSDTARVERALRERNEALETAGRLKSEFVASVSHELRTPLNTVIGFAEILNHQYFGPLNSSQLEYGRGIVDSSQQLMVLIDDILDLAMIEGGDIELERGRVEVAPMLHAVMSLTRERAHSRGLDISLRCPRRIGAIDGDERRLKQALFNLISNAIKFTPPGGAIGIEAQRCGGDLLLTVADTGIGIAPADQARVFEKFARGKRQAGSGLGLSLVKSLIELHGGTVEIEAAPGRGTRIFCRLPAAPIGAAPVGAASAAAAPAAAPAPPPGDGSSSLAALEIAGACRRRDAPVGVAYSE